MMQSELEGLSEDLTVEANFAVQFGIPLVVATGANPNALTYSEFEELKRLMAVKVAELSLLYRPS